MNWWEITLTVIGSIIVVISVAMTAFVAYFGWRMKTRGPF